jgi:hypothetical protein
MTIKRPDLRGAAIGSSAPSATAVLWWSVTTLSFAGGSVSAFRRPPIFVLPGNSLPGVVAEQYAPPIKGSTSGRSVQQQTRSSD